MEILLPDVLKHSRSVRGDNISPAIEPVSCIQLSFARCFEPSYCSNIHKKIVRSADSLEPTGGVLLPLTPIMPFLVPFSSRPTVSLLPSLL